MSWVWRFYIKKEEYGRDEQLHLIRKLMGVSQGQFDNMEVKYFIILYILLYSSHMYLYLYFACLSVCFVCFYPDVFIVKEDEVEDVLDYILYTPWS